MKAARPVADGYLGLVGCGPADAGADPFPPDVSGVVLHNLYQRAVVPALELVATGVFDVARFWAHRSLLAALRHAFGWGVARSALLMGALTLFTAAASHLGAPTVAERTSAHRNR